eukprot:TRINITY_DN907_c0_g1_i1.p1 TRINITY_DN907_c0_g1~~TRINITY_DN907_c0_g1_i1.p1  ORF type:complete len:719 (+),score=119.40 TRINITY_DN907_c0_g1_i1:267-2159(+)
MRPQKTALDQLLEKVDDPKIYRMVYDRLHDTLHELSDRDLQVIMNVLTNKFPNPDFDPFQAPGEYRVLKPGENPFDRDRSKKSFMPYTREEHQQVMRVVRRIRAGKIDIMGERQFEEQPDPNTPYLLWDDTIDDPFALRRNREEIPPPPLYPPGTALSYNPPEEFLLTKAGIVSEKKRKQNTRRWMPQKFKALRHVPLNNEVIVDRWRRCLDLFAETRKIRISRTYDPEKLLPDLPTPEELRPYPCKLGFEYPGHTKPVRSIHPSPNGQWLATGCDDCFLRVFEVHSGRLVYGYKLPEPVLFVRWNPNSAFNMLVACAGSVAYVIVPRPCATDDVNKSTTDFLKMDILPDEPEHLIPAALRSSERLPGVDDDEVGLDEPIPEIATEDKKSVEWVFGTEKQQARGLVIKCIHRFGITSVSFHPEGDYFATTVPKDLYSDRRVLVHILSKRASLNPFRKFKGAPISAVFGASDSLFYLVTANGLRVYNLVKQELAKRFLTPGCQWMAMDVHQTGDHILCGSVDRRLVWYDMDFGKGPYKKLHAHTAAVRCVSFHTRPSTYPLFASCGDDGHVHVYHGRVYSDLTKNPLIVPLKILKGHKVVRHIGVYQCQFHPTLPWLFTCGADNRVICWTE